MGPVGKYLIVAPLVALSTVCARAQDDIRNNSPSFEDALTQGRLILELRPRYNRIEETNKLLTTEGGTVRAVAG